MAKWQRTLNLLPEWEDAQSGAIGVKDLAAAVASRLKALEPFNDEYIDGEREELVEEFDTMSADSEVTADEFDDALSRLYDWADTPLDDRFGGKKVCWVKTF